MIEKLEECSGTFVDGTEYNYSTKEVIKINEIIEHINNIEKTIPYNLNEGKHE